MEGKVLDITAACKLGIVGDGLFGKTYAICYKGIGLWRTAYRCDPMDIKGCEIGLCVDEEFDGEELLYRTFSLILKIPIMGFGGDEFYSYGEWESREEADKWLENPVNLY